MVPLETFAVAAVLPVFVVLHDASIVMLFTMPTLRDPLSFRTPIHADWSRKRDKPARSPSAMFVVSRTIVAVEIGPWIRWVSVFLAAYRSLVTVAVLSVRPLLMLNLVVSGLSAEVMDKIYILN